MAKRISELDDAGTLTGAEQMEVVQSGGNRKITTSLFARIAQLGTNWWTALTTALGTGWAAIFAGTFAAMWDKIEPIGSAKIYFGYESPDSDHAFPIGQALSRTGYATLYSRLTKDLGTCTISIASPGVVTKAAHGLATGDCVEFTTTGALPTGLSVNTNYFVIYVDSGTYRLATTLANALAGTAINTSGTQSGTHSARYCPWGISGASNFLMPDAREATFYIIGQRAAGIIGAHDIAVLGQYMENRFQLHGHAFDYGSVGNNAYGSPGYYGFGSTTDDNTLVKGPTEYGAGGVPRTGATTRGNQLGVNILMRIS